MCCRVGLIAFELAANIVLPGGGELYHAIRRGDYGRYESEHLEDRSEEIIQLFKDLTLPDPEERPSAGKSLESTVFESVRTRKEEDVSKGVLEWEDITL